VIPDTLLDDLGIVWPAKLENQTGRTNTIAISFVVCASPLPASLAAGTINLEDHSLLIVFGGLPGTGKTTLAKAVAKRCAAVYLRIDTIEMAIRTTDVLRKDIGSAGYVTAYWVAEENLRLGRAVVADSVNPLQITRESWALVARNAEVPLVEVEVLCSDPIEHRQRIERRTPDLDGLPPLTWANVSERIYEKWSAPHLVIDTARKSVRETEQDLIDRLAAAGHLSV
jgi:predicted kinase